MFRFHRAPRRLSWSTAGAATRWSITWGCTSRPRRPRQVGMGAATGGRPADWIECMLLAACARSNAACMLLDVMCTADCPACAWTACHCRLHERRGGVDQRVPAVPRAGAGPRVGAGGAALQVGWRRRGAVQQVGLVVAALQPGKQVGMLCGGWMRHVLLHNLLSTLPPGHDQISTYRPSAGT